MGKSIVRFSVAGVTLAVVGLALAVPSRLLMADPTTRSQVWQLRLFGLGVGLVGWGAALLLPGRWRRVGVVLMLLATPGLALAVMAFSQGMAS